MFNVDNFIEDCKLAVTSGDGHKAVQALVERAVSDPSGALAGLGEPEKAGVQRLYVADDLTILNVLWGPQMVLMPHNHEMWAVIGVYTGREDNIFWRRIPEKQNGELKAAGARSLAPRDVAALGTDVIHSVINPVNRVTGAIHVYGGEFFQTPRSEWDPESLLEGAYDVEKNMRLFEESNQRLETA
jgi:predicted metal-dependent enzyme (double-stranded beta helix superfamily)